jgi:hypothetical protein
MIDGPISLTAAAALQRRREARIRSRELMRGFFQALAAGNRNVRSPPTILLTADPAVSL